MLNQIKQWFHKEDKNNQLEYLETQNEKHAIQNEQLELLIDEIKFALNVLENRDILPAVNQMRKNLILKVTQQRVGEILLLKKFENINITLSSDAYKTYLEEAEIVYRTRPWRDIVNKFQHEQLQYIMRFSDGGDIGMLQQLVSRGGILFADYAEKELNDLHLKHLSVKNDIVKLEETEKYKIFN